MREQDIWIDSSALRYDILLPINTALLVTYVPLDRYKDRYGLLKEVRLRSKMFHYISSHIYYKMLPLTDSLLCGVDCTAIRAQVDAYVPQ
jgi:hypothetical protein